MPFTGRQKGVMMQIRLKGRMKKGAMGMKHTRRDKINFGNKRNQN